MANDLQNAAIKLYEECFRLKRGERVLIVTDNGREKIANSLEEAAIEKKALVDKIKLNPKRENSAPVPKAAGAFLKADVIVAPTEKSISHSPQARLARKKGARIASMPRITDRMFASALKVNLEKIRQTCTKLKKTLDKAKIIEVKASGSQLVFNVHKRKFFCDNGKLWKKGTLSNIPFGEVCTYPVNSWGTLLPRVLQNKILPKNNGKIVIEENRMLAATGKTSAFYNYLKKSGKNALQVGELGFGTNPAFKKPTGNILQDEKMSQSAHVAFGSSCCYSYNQCKIHEDVVIENVKIWADGKTIKS
ncbi:MAG: aminopeptidase [Candidatus Micrarchaeia archaeon]